MAAFVLTACCVSTLPLISGCTSGGPPSNPARTIASEGSTRRVTGDWNDVESAALVGTNKAEAVVRTQTINTATLQEFDLQTVRDGRGTLRVSREQSDTDGESISIELWCHVGPFGDQARERQILDAVAERFADLRGVEFAPIR